MEKAIYDFLLILHGCSFCLTVRTSLHEKSWDWCLMFITLHGCYCVCIHLSHWTYVGSATVLLLSQLILIPPPTLPLPPFPVQSFPPHWFLVCCLPFIELDWQVSVSVLFQGLPRPCWMLMKSSLKKSTSSVRYVWNPGLETGHRTCLTSADNVFCHMTWLWVKWHHSLGIIGQMTSLSGIIGQMTSLSRIIHMLPCFASLWLFEKCLRLIQRSLKKRL